MTIKLTKTNKILFFLNQILNMSMDELSDSYFGGKIFRWEDFISGKEIKLVLSNKEIYDIKISYLKGKLWK